MGEKRHRNWCFTLNNYTTEEEEVVKAWRCKYLIFGHEVGERGTPHLQGYVSFASAKTWDAMKKFCPSRMSFRVAKGDVHQNEEYSAKEGVDVFEKGDKPKTPTEIGKIESDRWAEAYKAVEENRLEDVPKDILCSKLKSIQYAVDQVRISKRKIETLDGDFQNEWYYGPPGTGKSRKARTENPDAYIKDPTNKWWDGYKGQEVVIIEDFDKYQIKQTTHMKIWTDRYPFPAETKGGTMLIRPRKIITTSNYSMDQIWDDSDVSAVAMKRRHQITYFAPPLTTDPPSPNRFTSLPSRFQ